MSPFPCMGQWGIVPSFAALLIVPRAHTFFIKTMVANINNFGVINFYENNAQKQESAKKAEPVCEDISPTEESFSSVSPESNSGQKLFCRITKAAYDKGVAQQVDDDLRSASVSAPKLVKALNTNDALGYTDTKNLPSTKLFKLLDEHYQLTFDVRAFQIARSK